MFLKKNFIFLPLLFIAGCPIDVACIDVTSIQTSNLTLNFKRSDIACPDKVSKVTFFDIERKAILWEIWVQNISSDQVKPLTVLTYGTVPASFYGTAAKKLYPGQKIRIWVDGSSKLEVNKPWSFELTLTRTE